jgi:hypothetical protein
MSNVCAVHNIPLAADTCWRQVELRSLPDYEGYRFGSDGSVWSCWTKKGLPITGGSVGVMTDSWRRLKGSVDSDGYLRVKIKHTIKGKVERQVHQLILFAFVGPRPAKYEGCHNNGDRLDNRVENLRWDTTSENQKDAVRHGTVKVGRESPCRHLSRKLQEHDVVEIRRRIKAGETARCIAKDFDVCFQLVSRIKTRKVWAWL